jgi:uncharacterized LabA/DUF88 family protein
VSKNVAVFVDVANIFYAAKAAGVDIDYVTLLRSATAGRDFVRAYAYTGLDPENENQRQFHSFLARSGYRVVSKDIRKYGDGRIKANLDIELVVDMMRMAEHLDIAVVVSGDGDFAPAIRAVQQMGVRVEVISFRGNTSSDLIDVADVFIDIGHVARVEKGARSGRRVAAEGDLSMTEVPDKETGVTPRRRRPRRGEVDDRPERVVADGVGAGSDPVGLVALPGEKLSRATFEGPGANGPSEDGVGHVDEDERQGAGDRRRRRRGGRGRGRGGRAGEPLSGDVATGDEVHGVVGEELPGGSFADEVPTLPQHSGFGSVWDSQIGVTPRAASGGGGDVEALEDEPEVPEYLLAERRQQGRRRSPGARTRGGSGGYRSAIDRERFGAGGSAGYGSRGGGRGQGGGPRWSAEPTQQPVRRVASAEPWSEVPADVQELLRAEVSRRQATGLAASAPPASVETEAPTASAAPRGGRRRSAATSPEAAAAPATAGPQTAAEKPRRATTRRKTATSDAPDAGEGAPSVEAAAPEKPRRATTRRKTATSDAPDAGEGAPSVEAAATEKPRRAATRRKAATATESPGADES